MQMRRVALSAAACWVIQTVMATGPRYGSLTIVSTTTGVSRPTVLVQH